MKVIFTTDLVGEEGDLGKSLFSLVPMGSDEKIFCLDFAERLKSRRADIVVTNNKVILVSKQQQLGVRDKLIVEGTREVEIDYLTSLRLKDCLGGSVVRTKSHTSSGRCEFLVN